ncbi:MAG: YciI family protein [Pseudomonadota bacterium]
MHALITALSLIILAAASAEAVTPNEVERPGIVYAVICRDDPARAQVRENRLSDHLAFVEAHFERYAIAGPLLQPDGRMQSSLFLIYAQDEADARAFMSADPYVADGLYASMEYQRFVPAAGDWIGGVIWRPGQPEAP